MYFNILMPQAKHKLIDRKKNVYVCGITGEYKTTNLGSNGCIVLANPNANPWVVLLPLLILDEKHIYFYRVLNKIKYKYLLILHVRYTRGKFSIY